MKTPISYYGGKQRLAKRIIELIPEHKQYCEPFFGGVAVYFKKPKSEHEVINDRDNRVINFYSTIVNDFDLLQKRIQSTLHSEWYHQYANYILKTGKTLSYTAWTKDDRVNQAWAFWASTQQGFSNQMDKGWAFCSDQRSSRLTKNKREAFDLSLYDRIKITEIFNRDAVELIKLKDRVDTFFYIDPPYIDSSQGHYAGYTIEDFRNLLNVLSEIKGKFILSSYDSDLLREYVEHHNWTTEHIEQIVSVNNRARATDKKIKTECITKNF